MSKPPDVHPAQKGLDFSQQQSGTVTAIQGAQTPHNASPALISSHGAGLASVQAPARRQGEITEVEMTATETEAKPEAIDAKTEVTPSTAESAKAAGKQASPSGARKPVKPTPKKSDIILKLIKRSKGARIQDLQKATGWQAHSIRAALTGLRKQSIPIERQKDRNGICRYYLAGDPE